jgi:nucleotide-binding universal stress UspA family protein
MFDKILIATDLSQASDRVLRCTRGLIPLGAKTAVLVHALGIKYLEQMQHGMAHFIEPYLKKQKDLLEAEGFQVSSELALGPAVVEVNRIAKEQGASLVVVGSHGATLAREMLLGGTAMGILSHASLPVLLIRLKITEDGGEARCEAMCGDFREHVLYCTDFSETAEQALPYVERIIESGGKRVTLLHVQDRTRIETHLAHRLEEFNEVDRRRLESLREQLEQRGATEVRIEIPYGSPSREIVREAQERGCHLIVMGSQGRGFLEEVFLGSVAHQVIRRAPAPVLLVPPPGKKESS